MSIEDEDREMHVSLAIFGRSDPDVQPLVDLLRSDRPIPPGIRDMLAGMIDPKGDGYLHFRLELKNTEGKVRNHARDVRTLEIANYHASLVASGKSSNKAAAQAGVKFGLDPRKIYDRLRDAKNLRLWLRGKT